MSLSSASAPSSGLLHSLGRPLPWWSLVPLQLQLRVRFRAAWAEENGVTGCVYQRFAWLFSQESFSVFTLQSNFYNIRLGCLRMPKAQAKQPCRETVGFPALGSLDVTFSLFHSQWKCYHHRPLSKSTSRNKVNELIHTGAKGKGKSYL